MISLSAAGSSNEIRNDLISVFEDRKLEIKEFVKLAPEQLVDSVHLIRKRLKFLRALVKLTEFCSGKEDYKEINKVFRDCGRLISNCRDAHVRRLLLTEFTQNESDSVSISVLEKLNLLNQSQIESIEDRLIARSSVFDDLLANIKKESVWNYFTTLRPDSEALYTGYASCYEKSYRSFHNELRTHESELLHEWRKRTKDLQYQQEILGNSIPPDLPPAPPDVSQLCDLLGRINDLHMLSEWILESLNGAEINPLLHKIQQENKSVQAHADELGYKLYLLSPNQFHDKLQKFVLA